MNKMNEIKKFLSLYGPFNTICYILNNEHIINKSWLNFNYQYFQNAYYDGKMLQAHSRWFRAKTGRSMHFDNLSTFSEKLQWVKIFEKDPRKIKLSDKLESKKWASKKIGPEHVLDVIKIWDKPDGVNFCNLPQDYVLKFSHGSGLNFFVFDGRVCLEEKWMPIDIYKFQLTYLFSCDYAFFNAYEMQYHSLKPLIYAERMLSFDYNLKYTFDYKFWCFNGKPFLISCYEYNPIKEIFFTADLKYQVTKDKLIINNELKDLQKNLDRLLQFSSELSEGFNFARVDFFVIKNKIYFSEITFTPYSGLIDFLPEELDGEFASNIIVNKNTLYM